MDIEEWISLFIQLLNILLTKVQIIYQPTILTILMPTGYIVY